MPVGMYANRPDSGEIAYMAVRKYANGPHVGEIAYTTAGGAGAGRGWGGARGQPRRETSRTAPVSAEVTMAAYTLSAAET